MKALILLASLVFFVTVASAADSTRTLVATRCEIPPVIDGLLDENCWTTCTAYSGFVQFEPDNGAKPTERTEARITYDEEAIYVGITCFDSEPEKITGRLTRRDRWSESDFVWVAFDTYHDHQTGFYFNTNVSGVKRDAHADDDGNELDESWDAVWDVETRLLPAGWSAEFRIPFSQLRFVPSDSMIWGISIIRQISRKQERIALQHHNRHDPGFISRYSHLSGISLQRSPGRLEFLPFGVMKLVTEPASPGNPEGRTLSANGGLDLKFGISRNFTLDATFNPDFGQVEADQVVLNLSTFETFYPEKRPFFLEGARILQFITYGGDAGPGLFYSRRIGRGLSPGEARIPPGGYLKYIPDAVRILGAAKITGKTSDGFSLGALNALTKRESATIVDSTGRESGQVVEPLANYAMIRLRQDILENSNVGALVSAVHRESRFPAFTAGADWNLRFDRGFYAIDGFFAGSHTTGLNDSRISGTAGKISVAQEGGEHWVWYVGGDFTSKGYNINDIGFFRSPNDYGTTAQLRYKEETPARIVRSWYVSSFIHWRSNFDRAVMIREATINSSLVFDNYWGISGYIHTGDESYDQFETRGNGLYKRPSRGSTGVSFHSDDRNIVVAGFSQSYSWDDKNARSLSTGLQLLLKPATWTEIDLDFHFRRVDNDEAWITNMDNGFGGAVSVFGDRSTRELSMTLRTTTMFTRDMSLQVYAQLFFAKGHYANARDLLDAHSFGPSFYGGNPDFNRQAFNANVVFRWEYLPGSTMYLVWTQARGGYLGDYDRTIREDFVRTFDWPSVNVFLLKISYWLNG